VKADIAALKKASTTLDKLLEAQGMDVESVVADFKAARRRATASAKKQKVKDGLHHVSSDALQSV